jgi:hypothetical protein
VLELLARAVDDPLERALVEAWSSDRCASINLRSPSYTAK